MIKKLVSALFVVALMAPLSGYAGEKSTSTGADAGTDATGAESAGKTSDCDASASGDDRDAVGGNTVDDDCDDETAKAGSGSGTGYSGNKEAGY
ncbi:MAG: hypothetical protein ACE363_13060 [Alphaproteobacteria bacterium]